MLFTNDMRDLLRLFEENGVEYCVVGGFAVNFYGYIRTTQDFDVLIKPTPENARRTMQALTDFGFGEAGITEEELQKRGFVTHLGAEPNSIDLLNILKNMDLDAVFANVKRIIYEGMDMNLISLDDLLACKSESDRLKDKADVEELHKIHSKNE